MGWSPCMDVSSCLAMPCQPLDSRLIPLPEPSDAGLIFNPSHWDDGLKQAAPHIMSDHVLLGAAVQAGLASEACLPLLRWHTGSMQPLGHRIALGLHALVAAVLALLVAGESYFTVRCMSEVVCGKEWGKGGWEGGPRGLHAVLP